MPRDLHPLHETTFDLLVIGGGINGAGIARDAALRGLKVALVEKNDFASGTSSKTTKLIHGGIRYLEQFNFKLVFESCRERCFLLNLAPHLVNLLTFIIPVYKDNPRGMLKVNIGTALYDFLSGKRCIKRRQMLTAKEILSLEPSLTQGGLKGGVLYYDAQMNDVRLCLENILSARENDAVIFNYVEATGFLEENGKINAVEAKDNLTHTRFIIKSKAVVNAGGPWADKICRLDNPGAEEVLRPTKGIHLVYPKILDEHAILLSHKNDARIFFVIPWNNLSLIGTTDTDYSGSPDDIRVFDEDIDYLIDEAKRAFPGEEIKKEKIISSFAGLRPLIYQGEKKTWNTSREHLIWQSPSGLISVAGGKYTTYRKLSEEVVDFVLKYLKIKKEPCDTDRIPLYGGRINLNSTSVEELKLFAEKNNLEKEQLYHLMNLYGERYREVLEITERDKSLSDRICPHHLDIKAQIVYAWEKEMALTFEDIIERRLQFTHTICRGLDCAKAVKEVIERYS